VTPIDVDRPFAVTAARVLAIEAAVLLALWLLGRYFSG
jgi:hypothetical protein